MRKPNPRKVSEANKPFGRGPRSGRAERYPPPLGRAEQRSSVRIKTLALFERSEFASVPNAASSARNPKGTDVARLFFGYFFLATQKKVTRPPGRDPASHRSKVIPAPQHRKTISLLTFFRQSQKKVSRPPWRNPAEHPTPSPPPNAHPVISQHQQRILLHHLIQQHKPIGLDYAQHFDFAQFGFARTKRRRRAAGGLGSNLIRFSASTGLFSGYAQAVNFLPV